MTGPTAVAVVTRPAAVAVAGPAAVAVVILVEVVAGRVVLG